LNAFKTVLKIGLGSLLVACVFYVLDVLGWSGYLTSAVEFTLLALWAYWFIISLFGFGKASKIRDKIPENKFILIVPAHNEAAVIGNIVENLQNMDYPKHLYDVLVIADNCTDDTAKIASMLGANVLEHTSQPDEPKGKPHAIRYAFDILGDDLYTYDAFAIFDADNLVSLNYLKEMNNHLLKGERLIQCYLDTKNPDDNWITLGYGTSYYYMNRSWQLAKYRIGLGNAIGGTGFCVDTQLIKEVGWTATSLVEDLEFTMQCLLKGVRTTWAHHARVYDEKPTSFKASCIQRLRWARGHWDVAFRYTKPLLKRAFHSGDFRALDGALYLINPGKIVLGAVTGAFIYTSYFTKIEIFHPILPLWVWISLMVFNLAYIGIAATLDAGKTFKWVKAIFSLVIINYIYIPLFVWAMATTNNRTWVRTDHSRVLTDEEIEELGLQTASAQEAV
jgi:cellulose synthase/poly-beta-1,6-N-acetylglucosamine synthase-like glycosyltransferase